MKVRDETQFKEVLKDLVRGMSISQVAKKHGVAEITIYKYVQDAQKSGLLKREHSVDYIKKGKW